MSASEFWVYWGVSLMLMLGCFYAGIFFGRIMERADRRGRRTRSGDLLG